LAFQLPAAHHQHRGLHRLGDEDGALLFELGCHRFAFRGEGGCGLASLGEHVALEPAVLVLEGGLGGDVAGAFVAGMSLGCGEDAAFVAGVDDPAAYQDEGDGEECCSEEARPADGAREVVFDDAVDEGA